MERPKYNLDDFWCVVSSKICLDLTASREVEASAHFDDVESLRTLAEILVWSEQNGHTFFVYSPLRQFCEFQIPLAIKSLLSHAEDRHIVVQIIQTMSIICLNLNESSIRQLLEMNVLQELVTYPFDFTDEETGEYYITWVKGLALRIDASTIDFFITEDGFPLLERICQFYNHPDTMVSTAARTAAISLMRRIFYIDKHPKVPQVLKKVEFLPKLICQMRDLLGQIDKEIQDLQFKGLRNRLEDLMDAFYYCKDICLLKVEMISQELEGCLMYYLLLPVVFGSFVQDHLAAQRLSPQLSIGLLIQILDLFKGELVSDLAVECLLAQKLPQLLVDRMQDEPPTSPQSFSYQFHSEIFIEIASDRQSDGSQFRQLLDMLRSYPQDTDSVPNAVFPELLDLFRSKHESLILLLLLLSEQLITTRFPTDSDDQKFANLWLLVQRLVNVVTDSTQSSLTVIISAVRILTKTIQFVIVSDHVETLLSDITAGLSSVKASLHLEDMTSTQVITAISSSWTDLKNRWTKETLPSSLDLICSETTEDKGAVLELGFQRFMLLSNAKAALTSTLSAFSFENDLPVFLSYRSAYDWKEGETYEVGSASLIPCVLYYGKLSKNQVAYILDDDYYFILLKPNPVKLGVAEVVHFQELKFTSFHMAREQSRRLIVRLFREHSTEVTVRFEEHGVAWDVLELMEEKQRCVEEFEKSLVNSLLLE